MGSGGLAPNFYGGKSADLAVQRRYEGGEDQYADGTINPFLMPGYLSGGYSSADLTNITGTDIDNYIIATAVSSDNSIWFLEYNDSLHRLDGVTDTSSEERLAAIAATPTDLAIYTVNGVERLFLSRKDATTADINTLTISTNTYTNAWLSSVASGGFYLGNNNHRMVVADNGLMYVLDGASIHKIDGTTAGGANGTATANVLLFPATFQLIDVVDTRGNLWIALMQDTRDINTIPTFSFEKVCGVYVWDRQSTRVSMRDFIPIEGVTEIRYMFLLDGIPGCFTRSTDGYTQLRLFNGSQFEVVETLGQNDFPRYHGSVGRIPGGIVWMARRAFLFFYGKIKPSDNKRVLIRMADYIDDTSGTIEQGGALTVIDDAGTYLVFFGYNDNGGTYRIRRQTINSRTIRPSGNIFYTLNKPLPKLSTTRGITLYHLPITNTGTGTDTALTVRVYINQLATAEATFTITQDSGAKTFQWLPFARRNVNWMQLGISWNTANAINLGLHPSHAILEYFPPDHKKI